MLVSFFEKSTGNPGTYSSTQVDANIKLCARNGTFLIEQSGFLCGFALFRIDLGMVSERYSFVHFFSNLDILVCRLCRGLIKSNRYELLFHEPISQSSNSDFECNIDWLLACDSDVPVAFDAPFNIFVHFATLLMYLFRCSCSFNVHLPYLLGLSAQNVPRIINSRKTTHEWPRNR